MSATKDEASTTRAKATTQSKAAQTTSSQVMSEVASAVTNADTNVSQAVQNLGLVHQARVTQLTRTAATISARYGASSSQAEAANAAVTSAQAVNAKLSLLQKRVTLVAPPAPATGWAVYGHIYHSALKPAAAFTVFFVDEQNAYQANIGFAYTTADGSFQLSYTPEANAANVPIYFEVVNDKAQPVYLSGSAFQPQVGAANYLDVTLPAGEPVLGDPPAAIRAVAMPRAKGKEPAPQAASEAASTDVARENTKEK
jgi:hypothetical protein